MEDDPLTAETFARLASLPEDDPERQRWAASPEFEARLRLWREFESPAGGRLSAEEARSAARELGQRMEGAVRAGVPRGDHETVRSQMARREGPSWFQRMFGAPPRMALAFASILVIGVATTWFLARERTRPVERGATEHAAIQLLPERATPNGVELSWTAVSGADGYRVIFYGADLNEIARIDRVTETRIELRSAALPAGLIPGHEVLAEVSALHGEDAIAISKSRLITPR
jgi:hypothetical protein